MKKIFIFGRQQYASAFICVLAVTCMVFSKIAQVYEPDTVQEVSGFNIQSPDFPLPMKKYEL